MCHGTAPRRVRELLRSVRCPGWHCRGAPAALHPGLCPSGANVVCCARVSQAGYVVIVAASSFMRRAVPGGLVRRLRRSAALLAVAWLFGIAVPLHCIVHCAVHPFLLAASAGDPRQHVCHLDTGGDVGPQLASSRMTLPHVVQLLVGAPSLDWIMPLGRGAASVPPQVPAPHHGMTPPTPPPRG